MSPTRSIDEKIDKSADHVDDVEYQKDSDQSASEEVS